MEQDRSTLLNHEIEHGKKIIDNAEEVWGWSSHAGRIRADRRAKYIKDLTAMTSGQSVLEIGCGTGLFTEKLLSTGAKITATDLSQDLLAVAKTRLGEQCSLCTADAHSLPWDNDTFDIVYGSSILHHLQVEKALGEVYRVLKKDGRMLFAEPNMLNPQILLQKNIEWIKKRLGDSPDETAFIRWKIKKRMQKIGFIDLQVFPYDFLHPLTPVLLIPFVKTLGKLLERTPFLKEFAGSLIIYGKK
jgi:SAM-dependent methyltransferase